MADEVVLPAKTCNVEEVPELLSWLEEAEIRLVVHAEWTILVNQCKIIIVVSNDTDTIAILLHCTPYLQTLGLTEMWQQYTRSTGEKRHASTASDDFPPWNTTGKDSDQIPHTNRR